MRVRLLVLRHGKAGDGFPDSVRELTGRGRAQIEAIVARRGDELAAVDLAISSSLVRARQTLQIVLDKLGISPEILQSDLVAPGGNCREASAILADRGAETVLVASHQPFVSNWIHWLTGEDVHLSTGTLVAIDCDFPGEGFGTLRWVEVPDV